MNKFNNKTVLITGGSRGIGKATAVAVAEAGASVAINCKQNQEAAERTLKQLKGNSHALFQYDISNQNSQHQLINEVINKFGQLDILVNNAGISIEHDIDNINFEDWSSAFQNTFQTNLFAAANLSFLAAKHMIKNGGGNIINISSRGAFRGEPNKPAYGASKAALNAMSQSLAKKLAPQKVYVGVVAPGFTETDMATKTLTPVEKDSLLKESPFKRMAKPEEVAHAVLFLASNKAAYASGAIIDVNGASYLRS